MIKNIKQQKTEESRTKDGGTQGTEICTEKNLFFSIYGKDVF
jgi:hypothetical protein